MTAYYNDDGSVTHDEVDLTGKRLRWREPATLTNLAADTSELAHLVELAKEADAELLALESDVFAEDRIERIAAAERERDDALSRAKDYLTCLEIITQEEGTA